MSPTFSAVAERRSEGEFEALGLAGCHIEDQLAPKRCGHLSDKTLVLTDAMVARIKAAADARRDPKFLLIARTNARAAEGLSGAITRARLRGRRRGRDLPGGARERARVRGESWTPKSGQFP